MLNLRKLLMAGAAALMLAAPAYAPAGLALMPLAARAQEADENYTCAQLNDTVARLGEQAVVAITQLLAISKGKSVTASSRKVFSTWPS